MAMKEWFRKMQPIQLYVILVLTTAFFITELIVSHLTHALTLLMDSYHMLCNIMALAGCIITIKNSSSFATEKCGLKKVPSISSTIEEELSTNPTACHDKQQTKRSISQDNQEKKLKNTFGWARIDVIVMLICCVFLASLSFSILVEAIQTLIHIDHHDEMHHPISVLCIGAAGLLLNGVCYLLIGGYTFHQGSFLYVTESGDVILNKVVVSESLQRGERRLSRTKTIHSTVLPPKKREGLWEMARDINGCILVIICALLIFFTDKDVAKYIDPIISLVSVTFIMILSFPYMKESCLILLQTMPDTINIDSLKAELLNHFPDIVNIHDLHVWQLTASKVISTVHIIFQNEKVYNKIMEEVKEFFVEYGITHVTIQPEFFTKDASMESLNSKKFAHNCLMACQAEGCKQSHCCPNYKTSSLFKAPSREMLENEAAELKSVKVLDSELTVTRSHSVSTCSTNSIKIDETTELKDKNNGTTELRDKNDDLDTTELKDKNYDLNTTELKDKNDGLDTTELKDKNDVLNATEPKYKNGDLDTTELKDKNDDLNTTESKDKSDDLDTTELKDKNDDLDITELKDKKHEPLNDIEATEPEVETKETSEADIK